MKNLLVSGNTNELLEWDIQEVIKPTSSRKVDRDRMVQYDYDNKVGRCCDGMTYLEIEQFNNTYNNFK